MDYYKFKNIESDTRMRDSISDSGPKSGRKGGTDMSKK